MGTHTFTVNTFFKHTHTSCSLRITSVFVSEKNTHLMFPHVHLLRSFSLATNQCQAFGGIVRPHADEHNAREGCLRRTSAQVWK